MEMQGGKQGDEEGNEELMGQNEEKYKHEMLHMILGWFIKLYSC